MKKLTYFDNFIKDLSAKPVLNIFLVLLSSASFFLIAFNRNVNVIQKISLYVQFKPYYALPFFGLFLFLILSSKFETLKRPAALFLVLTLFALSLAGVWANTQTENFLLAGLIPRSDASYQYTGALKLLDVGKLNETASRRPFFGELLAFVLALTQRDLQLTIALLVFLVAISSWYAAHETYNALGSVPAIGFLFLVFLYFSRYIGTTMTENPGLIFGLLSLTFFLRSIQLVLANKAASEKLFIAGAFLYAMGQNARPGAVLALPLLILFSGFVFRNGKRPFNWKMIFLTFIAAALPFLINQLHFFLIGSEGAMPMSNMGYGLYGFVKGGKGWSQIFSDYPDLLKLPVNEQNRQILAKIFLEFKNHPLNIFLGFFKEFKLLFKINSQTGLLSFIQFDSFRPNMVISILMGIFYGLGLLRILIKRKSLLSLFLLTMTLGFIFSLPLAPASQTTYMRVYAASLPFIVLIPIYGLDLVISKLPFLTSAKKEIENMPLDNRIFSAILTGIIIISPLALMILNTKPPVSSTACPQGLTTSIVYYNPGSVIHIVEDEQLMADWVPNIHQAKFRNNVHNICCADDITFFESLKAPISIFASNDSVDGNSKYYVIADSGMLPGEKQWLQMCGSVSDIFGKPAAHGFFYPELIYKLN